jgi:hypothetical protein
VWEADSGRQVWMAEGPHIGVTFSPDGRLLG